MQGAPVYDYPSSTLTLNITVISDPSALKFRDGIARQTYQNALNPNQFAKVRSAAHLALVNVPILTQENQIQTFCAGGAAGLHVLVPDCFVLLDQQAQHRYVSGPGRHVSPMACFPGSGLARLHSAGQA